MKVALDPAMLNTRPIEVALRSTSDAGYAFVELGNRPDVIPAFGPVAASADELRAIRRLADHNEVEIASVAVIQAWSSPDEDRRAQAVGWWRDGIAAALALGCRRINTELAGDPGDPHGSRQALLHSLETLIPVIEREGVEVVAEPHPGDFVETTAGALELVEEVASSQLRYLHCVPHTYYLGGSVTDQIERADAFLAHVHVADTYRPERMIINPAGLPARIHEHFDIGQGEIIWSDVGSALRSVGFDDVLTIQVFGWDERAEESFRFNRLAVARLLGPANGT